MRRGPEWRNRSGCRAVAGAVGEHVVDQDLTWWTMLDDLGVVSLRAHP
jgi:hypothetical protein